MLLCVFCLYACRRLVMICSLFTFVFLKQKTAYEMRISDWSSDVCSSDLFNNTEWDHEFLDLLQNDPERLLALTHADFVRRGGAESVEQIMWLAQIGRASCRERVCQYA